MTISASTGIWAIGDNWPWPQVVFTDYFTLAFAIKSDGKLSLYELTNTNNTWTAVEKVVLGDATDIVSVSVSGFFTFYVLMVETYVDNNVDHSVFTRNPSTGVVTEASTNTIPAGITCCAFNGQLIIGSLNSSRPQWNHQCSVAWSNIGSTDMKPDDFITAGYAPMPWDENGNGKVWKVLALGDKVRVYGDRGICNLVPYDVSSTVGFGISEVEYPGILSADTIDGDDFVHGYIDTNYDWWLITGEKAVNLGYRKQMKTLTNRILVRYDKQNKKFYISDGVYSFVYTRNGMYSTHQCLTGIGNYKNIQCSFIKDNSDAYIRLSTTPFNSGHQSMATIEAIETGASYDTTADITLAGALSIKYDYKGDFMTLPWSLLNDRGILTQKATGREFKISLRGTYESAADFNLNSLRAKIKFSDKRNIRGRLNVS